MIGAVMEIGCAAGCATAALVLLRRAPAGSRGVPAALLASAGLLLVATCCALLDGDAAALGERAAVALAGGSTLPAVVLAYPRGLPTLVDRLAAGLAGMGGLAVLVGSVGGPPAALAGGGWGQVGLLLSLVWWRTERSAGRERTQLLWLALGVVAPALVMGNVLFSLDGSRGDDAVAGTVSVVALLLCAAAALAAVVVGLQAPDAVDVRRLISQVTRYTVSTELALAVFVGTGTVVEALRGAPMGTTGTALLAVAVAAAFHPVSLAVQRLFDELLFGGRTDPVAVMSTLGEQLRAGSTPDQWVLALCRGLGAERVELWDAERLLAAAEYPDDRGGRTRDEKTRIDLVVGGEQVGALVVVLGLGDDTTERRVRAVLDLVAPPLARALHGLRLTAELAAERAQALGALEEERRRLRRDLHDGLGPVLTGIAYSADAVRNLVRSDPDEAEALLAMLREDTASSIAEVRRLVVGLRPPALDELGLVAAVRQQVARLHTATGAALVVAVAEEGLPSTLPAALEVAAYRVAVEAVTNAARHAARTGPLGVRVCFRTEPPEPPGGSEDAGAVVVEVTDDAGPSAVTAWRPGVGMSSMRERCEALHGSVEAGPTPSGGRVRAVLPLLASSASSSAIVNGSRSAEVKPYRTPVVDLGAALVPLDRTLALAGELEDEELVRRMENGS